MPQLTFGRLSDTRRNNFDFLRFFFASLVIFSHSFLLFPAFGDDFEPLWRLTHAKMNFGTLSVACFFAISGFLITQSWVRQPQAGDFFRKRFLRIYPGWIVALLFCVFVVAPWLRPGHGLALHDIGTYGFLAQLILRNTGFLHTLPGVGMVNGSVWTIPFEILCYCLVALVGLLGGFRRPLLMAFLGILLLAALNWPALRWLPMYWPAFGTHPIPYIGWLRPLPQFAVFFLSGMLFFLFRDRIPHSPRLLAVSVLLVGLTLGSLPLSGMYFVIFPTFGFYVLFYLAFVPLGKLYDWAKHGDLSYGIYLYAYPIQRLLIAAHLHGIHLSPLSLFFAAWVLACGAAALSWRFVERPFLRLKPKSPLPSMEDVGVPAVPATGAPSA